MRTSFTKPKKREETRVTTSKHLSTKGTTRHSSDKKRLLLLISRRDTRECNSSLLRGLGEDVIGYLLTFIRSCRCSSHFSSTCFCFCRYSYILLRHLESASAFSSFSLSNALLTKVVCSINCLQKRTHRSASATISTVGVKATRLDTLPHTLKIVSLFVCCYHCDSVGCYCFYNDYINHR